jgi:hypothetical protein
MFREYVFSNAHNSSFTPKFATPFCPSYFVAQEVSVAPKVSATRQVIQTNGFPNPHAIGVPSNTLEKHSISSCVVDGVHNLVSNFSMAKLMASPTFDFTFTYQKGAKNTSLVDLLLNKGVVDNHFFYKISHSFPKVVPSERTCIVIKFAIVDNIKLVIQVGGHTPRVVLLDTGAQPMILGVQFTKKIGMLDSKLWKFIWQIYIVNGNVEGVIGESLDFITLNFNEDTYQELCLQVICLIINATS